jgi:hypothetical protein
VVGRSVVAEVRRGSRWPGGQGRRGEGAGGVEDRGGEDRPPAAWRTGKAATDGAGSLEDRGEDVGSPEDRGESASSLQDSGEDDGSMEDRGEGAAAGGGRVQSSYGRQAPGAPIQISDVSFDLAFAIHT